MWDETAVAVAVTEADCRFTAVIVTGESTAVNAMGSCQPWRLCSIALTRFGCFSRSRPSLIKGLGSYILFFHSFIRLEMATSYLLVIVTTFFYAQAAQYSYILFDLE